MQFQLGLENNVEGRSLVWVFGHPGCFAYGQSAGQALAAAPQAIREYVDWISRRTARSWLTPDYIETHLDETWQVYDIDEDYQLTDSGYSVNAWFRHDWLPLSEEDVSYGLQLLAWSREDLLGVVSELTSQQLEAKYPGERWNIAGILRHVGGAEWWYLDRLGLAYPRQEVPDDPYERLPRVREHLNEALPRLVGSSQVVGVEGEFWSGRKLLRRAVWHERDHTQHIRQLIK